MIKLDDNISALKKLMPSSIEIIAVSKKQTLVAIRQVFNSGINQFAESYVQEALVKIQALADLPICWHFIGRIQSNKAADIAKNFSWAHGVCRPKIAQLLNDNRPDTLAPLNVCIQINIDNNDRNSGILAENLNQLAQYITSLPRLHLRGLMAILKPNIDENQQYLQFAQVANLLKNSTIPMDTLSLGMSDDFPAAIRAGTTMVRIGRKIFGERE
jgi:pyridoxal phosphate enzyme (YggS family)